MKAFALSSLAICLSITSACGGGPTSPTSPSVSMNSSAPLQLIPASTTLAVGQSVVITASGGDGYNYVFYDAQPSYGLTTEMVSINSVRITAISRAYGSTGTLRIDGMAGNQVVSKEATINIK